MATYDRISALFWIGMALAICVESIRLGVGFFSNPGPGLFPFGCGLILGIASLIVFVSTFINKQEEVSNFWISGIQWGNIILIIISLIAYAFLLNLFGFHLVTLLWVGFMCRGIAKMRWRTVIFISVFTAFSCYLLFERILNVRFPRGILGF